jgi:hypothetical protein
LKVQYLISQAVESKIYTTITPRKSLKQLRLYKLKHL